MDVNFPRGFRVAGGVCCKASPDTLKSNHPLTMRILSIHSLQFISIETWLERRRMFWGETLLGLKICRL